MPRSWTLREMTPGRARPGMHEASVRAFDETEAAEKMLAALGLELVPCCEVDQDPCESCAEEAYERSQEMRGYRGQPSPEEIRAQDADRGMPWVQP